jgi:hypothetical protein
MTDWRRIAALVSGAIALGYLAAMVMSGAQPVQRQFVKFEAKGLLKTQPEQISRVELVRADEHATFLRRGENSWATSSGAEIAAEPGRQISTAVQMMHNSGPAREIPPGEVEGADAAAFGLDAPRIAARFYASAGDPVLAVRFGALNPDEFLQYTRIEGDDHLYLMSRFIGEAWVRALDGSLKR